MSERELPLPPRPAIPAALWALASACACQLAIGRISLSLSGDEADILGLVGGSLNIVALLGACWAFRLYRRSDGMVQQTLVAVLTCMLCSSASACLCNRNGVIVAQRLCGSAMSGWRFEVLADSSPTETGFRCRARARADGSPSGDVWLLSEEDLARGSIITCIGRFRPLRSDAYGVSSWCQGVRGSVSVMRIVDRDTRGGPMHAVGKLRERVLQRLQGAQSESRALLAGCVCGSRAALDECGLTEVFATCGLSHMVAVSGAHLSTVAALASVLLERLDARIKLRAFLLGTLTGLFVLFCGCPISAVRAWLMLVVAYASQLAGRRTHAISSVSLVSLGMVLVDPTVVGQLGFQLSVLSVIGLCLYTQHASYMLRSLMSALRLPRNAPLKLRRKFDERRDEVCQMLAATLVCQLITMPLCTSVFGRLSLVAPLACLLATPVLAALMGMGLLACLLMWFPPCSFVLLAACDVVASPLLLVLHRLASMPLASFSSDSFGLPLGYVAVVLLLVWLIWWPKLNRRIARTCCAAALLAGVGTYAYWRCMAPARIVVLDVGQGDAILVQDGASAVLVDTGPGDAVVSALARRHVLHLDAVVLTHLHDDHYGGLQELAGKIGCNHVMVANGVGESMPEELQEACVRLTSRCPEELSYGDVMVAGNFRLRVIWPHDEVDGDENSESLQLMVSYKRGDSSLVALLTGDAEQDELASCIRSGDVADIDLLKVGHHGSEVSLTAGQALRIAPELAVASAGEGNRYGHPTRACIEALDGAGAHFLCTKDVGDVEVRPGANGPKVRVYGLHTRDNP